MEGGGPKVDELAEHVGEVGLRIDAVQFAGLDQRGNAGPILRPLIVAGEQCILAIEHDRTDAAFDDVGIEFDAAVIEETDEPVPVIQAITALVGDRRLAGDEGKLVLEVRRETGKE